MGTGTTLLALAVLGGAGYGAYKYLEQHQTIPASLGGGYDKWELVASQAKGKRYAVYLEGVGPKGFGPIVVTSAPGTLTNSLEDAKRVLAKVSSDLIDEANDVATGKQSPDVLRGITSQEVGIYNLSSEGIVERYNIETPKAPARRKSGGRRR
jgi:hypothetical protein